MSKLLVIDDEPTILHSFRRAFRERNVTLLTAGTAAEGTKLVAQQRPDVVILDVQLPDLSGLEAFDKIRAIDSKIPVIFITGHGTTETAIEATKRGAFDYLFKPLELSEIRRLVDDAIRISRMQCVRAVMPTEQVETTGDILVGRSPAMNEVYKAIGRVSPQDVTVLITGESGTGKELVARAIYHHSKRQAGPFLAINCAAIPDAILESELFGHEQGAFTGADRLRIGKFEQGRGGTLFLDEVGDMSPVTQTKILRVLAEQRFQRVGGDEVIETDVRLIAATNRDLENRVTEGAFRNDLYYRLSVFTIQLPPLRDRGDDVPMLVEYFLRRFNLELGKQLREISPAAMKLLCAYQWPGNVRELQSVLKQSMLNSSGPVLLPEFLPDFVNSQNDDAPADHSDTAAWESFLDRRLRGGSNDLFSKWKELTERHLLSRVIHHTNGNLSQAARILGINRRTLRTKLLSLGILSSDDD